MKLRKGTTYLQNDDYTYESTIEMFNWYYYRDEPIPWILTLSSWEDDLGIGYIDTDILLGNLLPTILGEEYVSTIYRNHKR